MNLCGRCLKISRRTMVWWCCLLVLLGIGTVFVFPLWEAFKPHSMPHATLTHAGGRVEPALRFPSSAVLVDAYAIRYIGPDGTLYYRVQMQRSDIEEFMRQEPMKDLWYAGNAVADHLTPTLKWRWREISRCRDCRSWEGKGRRADLEITVCLDDSNLATVYIYVFEW